jgi:hypothetical protein
MIHSANYNFPFDVLSHLVDHANTGRCCRKYVDLIVIVVNSNSTTTLRNIHEADTGRAMAQAVSRRPLTAQARVRSRGSVHVGFVVDKVTLGQVSPRVLWFLLSISFRRYSITRKIEKKIIFITVLHIKLQG